MLLEAEPSQNRLPIMSVIRDPAGLAAVRTQPKSPDPNVKNKAMRCRQLLLCFGVPSQEGLSSCCPRVGKTICTPGDGDVLSWPGGVCWVQGGLHKDGDRPPKSNKPEAILIQKTQPRKE